MGKVRLTVPGEIAGALGDLEGVEATPSRRSSWAIAVDALTGFTTTIAVLQAPQTLEDVARRMHPLLQRLTGKKGEAVTIDVTGPNGQRRLTLTDDTDVDEVINLLRQTLDQSADRE